MKKSNNYYYLMFEIFSNHFLSKRAWAVSGNDFFHFLPTAVFVWHAAVVLHKNRATIKINFNAGGFRSYVPVYIGTLVWFAKPLLFWPKECNMVSCSYKRSPGARCFIRISWSYFSVTVESLPLCQCYSFTHILCVKECANRHLLIPQHQVNK